MTSIAEVRSSLHAHRGRIGGNLDSRPASRSAESFSYQAHFDHMDEELATIQRELIKAEDVHVRQLIQIRKLRRQSQELASAVYDKQTSARQILNGLYGSEHDFELAATSGKTPQVPQTLSEQVDQTVKLLRNPAGAVPKKKVAGVKVDFGVMADDLETDLERLDTSRTDYGRNRKEADATRKELNSAIAEYDKVFPWVASNLESLFRLAGEHELADRIRTSISRVTRRRSDGEEEKPEDSAAEESAAEEAAAESAEGPPPADSSDSSESAEAPSPAG